MTNKKSQNRLEKISGTENEANTLKMTFSEEIALNDPVLINAYCPNEDMWTLKINVTGYSFQENQENDLFFSSVSMHKINEGLKAITEYAVIDRKESKFLNYLGSLLHKKAPDLEKIQEEIRQYNSKHFLKKCEQELHEDFVLKADSLYETAIKEFREYRLRKEGKHRKEFPNKYIVKAPFYRKAIFGE